MFLVISVPPIIALQVYSPSSPSRSGEKNSDTVAPIFMIRNLETGGKALFNDALNTFY